MRITTVAQFAAACNSKTHDEIYDLFEFEISQALRDEIYGLLTSEELDYPEPMREAMRKIGKQYNMCSLQEY